MKFIEKNIDAPVRVASKFNLEDKSQTPTYDVFLQVPMERILDMIMSVREEEPTLELMEKYARIIEKNPPIQKKINEFVRVQMDNFFGNMDRYYDFKTQIVTTFSTYEGLENAPKAPQLQTPKNNKKYTP